MRRVLFWVAVLVCCLAIAVVGTFETIPTRNTDATHFDTIIVLGSPPDPDGRPSSEQRERVQKAVEDFRAGRSSHIILSGGAAHSTQAEARVMATVASQEGVPANAMVIEDRSRNTIENVYFSNSLMEEHGWTSAEVVSSPSHLARAALILEHYKLRWAVEGSKWPAEYSFRRISRYYAREIIGTTLLRWFGFPKSDCLPVT